jgi:hypothetical protein
MLIKQILRNKTPLVHFVLGLSVNFIFGFLLIFSKVSLLYDFNFFLLGAITINFLNLGYFGFGFSYDYNVLLILNSENLLKKYLFNKTILLAQVIIVNYLILLIFLFFKFSVEKFFILNSILFCGLSLIPLQVFLYILLFKKINFIENKFVIIRQSLVNFLSPLFQVLFIGLYFFLYNSNVIFFVLFLICYFSIFCIRFNFILKLLTSKISNEYIRG